MALNMPAQLTERARELAEGGPWVPPEARPAATVVLLRDGAAGLEVLLMGRPDTMAFAPGMHVFPGGRVEPETDGESQVVGSLPSESWAPEPLARAIAVAAVRETFEEAGVLLAVDRHGRHPLPDDTWEAARRGSELDGTFGRTLKRRHLHIDTSVLVPIAHWITPEVESRRYDTRFFAAALPPGQEVSAHVTETATAHWLSPDEALAGHGAGHRPMLPPTVAVLRVLSCARTVADALECARRTPISPLLPRPRIDAGILRWELVHAYTGEVLSASVQPAGSEERGNRP